MLTEITSSEQVDAICDLLKTEWPQSMLTINTIRICHEWKQRDKTFSVSLLYSKGNEKSGVFVSLLKSGCVKPIITVYVLETYEEILKNELLEWDDWPDDAQSVTFFLISPKHVPIIDHLTKAKGFAKTTSYKIIAMAMPIEKALNLDVVVPEDVHFGPLSQQNLDTIYETWVMNDVYTMDMLQKWNQLDNESNLGLFDKKSGALLSRCLRAHNGQISALQTAEFAQGRGYAKLLIKKLSKLLAEKSIMPTTQTTDFNKISSSVFHSVGYENVCQVFDIHYDRVR